jgi:hypothetical protein
MDGITGRARHKQLEENEFEQSVAHREHPDKTKRIWFNS